MLASQTQLPMTAGDAAPPRLERRIALTPVTAAGAATVTGAAFGALGLTWVLFERLLPLSGVLGFWLWWYVTFLVLYGAMAWLQWDTREASSRVTSVMFATAGLAAVVAVAGVVIYTAARSVHAVAHVNFFLQNMATTTPRQPLSDGGVVNAIIGTLEQIGLATAFAVPLGLAAALFLAEVGGALARPVRVIVEAMTSLPDILAGLFVYALFILTLGMQKSGLAAALALAVTMMPIIARASEVVIRLVPGTLREAAYALGSSQWRTAWSVVLPTARSGLTTAAVLGMARGIGETAPVLVVAGFTNTTNYNPLSGPQMDLPDFIWGYGHTLASVTAFVERGFGAGLVLVLLVVVLFTIARRIGGAPAGELTKRQRRRLARTGGAA